MKGWGPLLLLLVVVVVFIGVAVIGGEYFETLREQAEAELAAAEAAESAEGKATTGKVFGFLGTLASIALLLI
jgi:hypothetical protein